MITKSRKKLSTHWLIIILFLFNYTLTSAQKQKISLLDSIAIKIESKISINWKLEKLNDSILILKREDYIPYGYRDIRRVNDSLQYKLFIILHKKYQDEATCVKEFIDLTLKLKAESDTITDIRHTRGTFSFDKKYLVEKYLPYQIPPNLFFSSYTITIFDNVSSGFHVLKLEGVEQEIDNMLQNISSSLNYDKKPQFYQDYVNCYDFEMINIFGGVHWGILRLVNYPELKPFFD